MNMNDIVTVNFTLQEFILVTAAVGASNDDTVGPAVERMGLSKDIMYDEEGDRMLIPVYRTMALELKERGVHDLRV